MNDRTTLELIQSNMDPMTVTKRTTLTLMPGIRYELTGISLPSSSQDTIIIIPDDNRSVTSDLSAEGYFSQMIRGASAMIGWLPSLWRNDS